MMKNEFMEAYQYLFENTYNRLRRTIKVKLKAINYCNKYMYRDEEHYGDKRRYKGLGGEMLVNKIKEQVKNPFPEGFVLKPVDAREVDEDSEIFYTSSENDSSDSCYSNNEELFGKSDSFKSDISGDEFGE